VRLDPPTSDSAAVPVVLHVIPYDSIGGVEVAARSLPDGQYRHFAFAKYYLVSKSGRESMNGGQMRDQGSPYRSENDPRAYFRAVNVIWKIKPNLVIASLWRSCIVLLLVKLLRPRTRAVTFLHSAMDVHWPDRALNMLAMRFSDEIWADSQATLEARVPEKFRACSRVISFLTGHRPMPVLRSPAPRFVFWGRLHAHKGLVRALRLFAQVVQWYPAATFHLIGPDGGDAATLEREIQRLELSGVVFKGPMKRDEIFKFAQDCCFYLQTSVDEGMGMSVIEAMQLALVPIVTPVGQIGSYCRDGDNAIVVINEQEAVAKIRMAIDRPTVYQAMSERAHATWRGAPLYCEDVIASCAAVLERAAT
jgi:glycosyltransferase involved in cell wall biosynthesis